MQTHRNNVIFLDNKRPQIKQQKATRTREEKNILELSSTMNAVGRERVACLCVKQ